jgi:hypothetical protein
LIWLVILAPQQTNNGLDANDVPQSPGLVIPSGYAFMPRLLPFS